MKKMTEKALQEAFAGESMAHMKYLIFSEEAEKKGYKNLARLFKAIAYAEFVHARNHAKEIGIVGDVVENIKAAIEGETFEVEEMYPAYNAIAELQGEEGAKKSIHYAVEAEKIHAEMYRKAEEMAKQGKDVEIKEIYVCPVCGYTHEGEPPANCPVCGAPKETFVKF
ncbi:MAG TPA: rubrerythrin family protein [Thermoplasmatales archaeon]|nr:rubrerythrin family protein [Thermoplasmatales archaeon]